MPENKKEDLRVQRTKEFIRKTFEEMICEMDYEQISIKELVQHAKLCRQFIPRNCRSQKYYFKTTQEKIICYTLESLSDI